MANCVDKLERDFLSIFWTSSCLIEGLFDMLYCVVLDCIVLSYQIQRKNIEIGE